jgi:hypothetical protein
MLISSRLSIPTQAVLSKEVESAVETRQPAAFGKRVKFMPSRNVTGRWRPRAAAARIRSRHPSRRPLLSTTRHPWRSCDVGCRSTRRRHTVSTLAPADDARAARSRSLSRTPGISLSPSPPHTPSAQPAGE